VAIFNNFFNFFNFFSFFIFELGLAKVASRPSPVLGVGRDALARFG